MAILQRTSYLELLPQFVILIFQEMGSVSVALLSGALVVFFFEFGMDRSLFEFGMDRLLVWPIHPKFKEEHWLLPSRQ